MAKKKVRKLKKADLERATSVLLAELAKAPGTRSSAEARAHAATRFLKEISRLTGALIAAGCGSQGCGDPFKL